jgi:hypothetical protein
MRKLQIRPLLTLGAKPLASSATARTVTIPFNPANFPTSPDIDNRYFPLPVGAMWTYKADTSDGCEVDVTTVTGDTRSIDGVTTRVVRDKVFEGESCTTAPAALAEDTRDYYAQDSGGNVWYFGEDSFECEGAGNCERSDGSWLAGVRGAKPGVIMLANPRSGDTYFQEQAAGVALDQATVTSVGVREKMTRDDAFRSSYNNCIVTKEFTTLEKGGIEFKTYCPNIGNVLTIEHHGKIVRLELTDFSSPADALRFRVPPKH